MNDRNIDRILQDAPVPPGPHGETLDKIAESIVSPIGPVRPMPATWLLAAQLALICALVAFAAAAPLGFFGLAKMKVLDRFGVFSALCFLILVAAPEVVRTVIPGSRRRLSSGSLLATAVSAMAAVLFLCFRELHTTRFLHAGLVCLTLGSLTAAFTALFLCIVLRRGFAADAGSAGLAGGTLAGLVGVTMLELHCPNFETAHLLVWHVGVLFVSAGLGAVLGWHSPGKHPIRR